MKLKKLENFPVIIGFIGVLLGSVIVGYYQNRVYKSQRFDKRIETKEHLLEEAYRVYARMPEIQFWQQGITVNAPDSATANNWIYNLDKERNSIIAKQFSDLLALNKMIELYFGENSKMLIQKTFTPQNHKNDWWNIMPETLNAITESMANEIKKDIEQGI